MFPLIAQDIPAVATFEATNLLNVVSWAFEEGPCQVGVTLRIRTGALNAMVGWGLFQGPVPQLFEPSFVFLHWKRRISHRE